MIMIGTSGWVYKHWIGCFYPPELKQADWLGYFARHFSTVEINRSLYRLPHCYAIYKAYRLREILSEG
jgi:uncharacterized protein YecE (DUF72 family)